MYLTKWDSPQTLMNGAMNGAILENYCVSEIVKGYEYNGKEPYLYFYVSVTRNDFFFHGA